MRRMKIEVLGVDCNKCEYVFKFIEKTCAENKLPADVEFVCRMDEILARGVMMTPAVIIDGETKCVGRVPSKAEIKQWLGC